MSKQWRLPMPKNYSHLTYESRCQIYALKQGGASSADIAAQLGVHKSTINREINRNSGERGYRFKQAQELAEVRRHQANRGPTKMLDEYVAIIEEKLINEQWSPEQISGWMKLNLGHSLSHETIYEHIRRDKKQGGNLYKNLRHGGKKYRKDKNRPAGKSCIPARVDIDERPDIVEKKERIGDWELDTIIGKNHVGAIVSMVDRASKFTKLMLVPDKKSDTVSLAINEALTPLKSYVLTMTADNGGEFAGHQELNKSLDAQVYFAKPYHSWERGLNEHTNGLVRQYFPKGTKFDSLTQDEVLRVETLLNSRPRKALNFQTPMEVFQMALSGSLSGALRT
jgi:transposase, IS30 family